MKKRFLQLFVLVLLFLPFFSFISAQAENQITGPSWAVKLIDILNWGTTWQEVLIMIFVLVILFTIIYNALSIASFSKGFFRFVVAFSVSVLATTQFGLSSIYVHFMKLVGDFFIISLFGLIITAIVIFLFAGWIKGRLAVMKIKDLSENLKLAHEIDRIERKTI